MSGVPNYLSSTVDMLTAAYPDGIPESAYFAILHVLKNDGEMSDRAVAEVMASLKGGWYTRYHYDVAHAMPNMKIMDSEIVKVVEKLSPHGYDKWLLDD